MRRWRGGGGEVREGGGEGWEDMEGVEGGRRGGEVREGGCEVVRSGSREEHSTSVTFFV